MQLDCFEIPFESCTVSFRLPSTWVEGEEDGVGAVFGLPGIDDGALRLDVISVTVSDYAAQKRMLEHMNSDGRAVALLTNGNALRYYCEPAKHDEEILLHYWHLGCAPTNSLFCLLVFSFTLFKSRAQSPEALQIVEFLDEEIRNATTTPRVSAPQPTQHGSA